MIRLAKLQSLRGLFVAFILFSAGCGQKGAPAFERPPALVTISEAVSQDVPIYIDAVGKTVAREVVTIHPQVSGRIVEIHFADGAELKKGQTLFTIDTRPYLASLHAAEATLSQKKAQLQLANLEFARAERLVDALAISKQDYDAKQNGVDVAKAEVQQSEAALETARLNLDYCSIRSPINGRAGKRLVDLGNVVKPEDEGGLLVIQNLDPIYADFTITENDLSAVQHNMAQNSLQAEVRLPDDPAERQGELSFVDNSVQEETGTVKLRATIPNKDAHFWPGRFVNVRLVLSTIRSAVLVAATATQMSANGPFVYVVKPDSTAELRPVTLGQKQGDLIVITKGVQAGEQVVTNGQLGVTPGGKVQPAPAAPTKQGEQS